MPDHLGLVNNMLGLVLCEEDGDVGALRRIGFSQAWVEVPNVPGGPLPIDVLIRHIERFEVLAAECKDSPYGPRPEQHERYLSLDEDDVGEVIGCDVSSIDALYVVSDNFAPQFLAAQAAMHQGQQIPGTLPVVGLGRRAQFVAGSTHLANQNVNPIFTQGTPVAEFAPRYIDVLPDGDELTIRRFVLGRLPQVLRGRTDFTADTIASLSSAWSLLATEARNRLSARVASVVDDLRTHEFSGWVTRAQGQPGWRNYRRAQTPAAIREVAARLADARQRWNIPE